ncbi:MAG: Rrf2 family transcriptional regulator [Treponema sp.]|nr:Rrf2 family transcriptional regulator [Treponema sp.]
MLKISTRGQYALLIMMDLAEAGDESYIPLKTLSHRRNLSVKYLEQILIHLGKSGLVIGSRGTNGGYRLSRPVNDYTAGDILRAMEGELSPRGASENNHLESEGNDFFWKEFTTNINNFVDSITLDELVQKNRAFVGYEYCI